MIGGGPIAARAIGDTGSRDLPGEWSGPDPATLTDPVRIARERGRRTVVRKP